MNLEQPQNAGNIKKLFILFHKFKQSLCTDFFIVKSMILVY